MNMKQIMYALKIYYKGAEEAEKIIIECALVAAVSSAVGSTIPILALPSIIMSCLGAVWAMYIKLSKCLGIPFTDNVLKVLASAALSNIATNLISVLITEIVAAFVPGVSVAAGAVMTFVCVYLAGMMFMKMILAFAKNGHAGSGLGNLSKSELKSEIKKNTPTKDDVKNAKDEFGKNHK